MSHLKSQPYLPAEGREFVEYMGRVLDGVTELRAEGRIPDDEGVDKLLQLWRTVTKQVKSVIWMTLRYPLGSQRSQHVRIIHGQRRSRVQAFLARGRLALRKLSAGFLQ